MRVIALIVRAGAVVAASAFVFSLLVDGGSKPATAGPDLASVTKPVPKPAPKARTTAKRATPRVPQGVVAIVATGDVVMGSTPNLPPDGGRSFFSDVQTDLAGDVVLGNLEGTLSTGGGSKCRPRSSNCFAFQTPPSYARWLQQAGFTVMNLANNHAFDFGAGGLEQTTAALDGVGLLSTGRPGQITVQQVGDIRVALVGFAPYPWAQSLTDIAAAKRLVRKASRRADVVVVTMHAGAEGTSRQHVTRRSELFLGENRGNPVRFAHAVVDAGADLVIGHGPHVLRGMEWYKQRLIAYSLGNFAGYGVFSLAGPTAISGILRVTLRADGSWVKGVLVPTALVGEGLPVLDPAEQAHGIVRGLSRDDFGGRGIRVTPTGVLEPPAR